MYQWVIAERQFKDMINIIKLDFVPHTCCWVHRKGLAQGLLAMLVCLLLGLRSTNFVQVQIQPLERYASTTAEVEIPLSIVLRVCTVSRSISWP